MLQNMHRKHEAPVALVGSKKADLRFFNNVFEKGGMTIDITELVSHRRYAENLFIKIAHNIVENRTLQKLDDRKWQNFKVLCSSVTQENRRRHSLKPK